MNIIQHPIILQKITGFGVDLTAHILGYGLAAFLVILWLADAQLLQLRARCDGLLHLGNTTRKRT